MEISAEMKAALQQQLPAMFAKEMDEFLKQAARDAATVVSLKDTILDLESANNTMKNRLRSQDALDAQALDIATKLQDLAKRELELLTANVKNQVEVVTANNSGYKEAVNAFLKLPSLRTDIMATVSKPVAGHPGGSNYSGSPGTLQQATDTSTTTHTPI
jgi:hypothetical protein